MNNLNKNQNGYSKSSDQSKSICSNGQMHFKISMHIMTSSLRTPQNVNLRSVNFSTFYTFENYNENKVK